jgi:serine phosphatase RsbU (regulator of sigma subunit)
LWGLALVLLPLVFQAWYRTSRLPLERVSIVPRTILLFGMTVLMPASLLLGMGVASFREQALTLERQAFDEGVARLRTLDHGFERFRERLLAFDRRIRDHPVIAGPDSPRVTRLANRFRARGFASRFESRNVQGELIGCMQTTETTTQYLTSMFAKEVLRRFLGSVIPYENEATRAFSQQVLQSALIGFAGIFDQPDTLLAFDFDRQNTTWYYDVRSPTPDRPLAYMLIIHQTYSLHEAFLKTALGKSMYAFQDRYRRWFPGKPPHPIFAVLAAESLYGRRTARRVIRLPDGRSGLAIAYPSSQMGGYVFTTIADLSSLVRGERQLRRLLAASLALLVLLAVTYASFLAEALITPVKGLADAVAALERRDFTHRLPVRGADEFGTLARAFNHLIEDFGDLDFAREVQRNLLPARPPTLPGYAMLVYNRSATDLGGDYCDTLMTADGRVLLITGDVTGHGISSALVATMAKTTGVLAAREGWPIPRLLESLNRLLFQVFQRKKMMTMVVALLDPRAHTLEWTCVGHPFPIVRRADGHVASLSMVAYPLGARKTLVNKMQMQAIHPGDLVMFYSDGVVEAQNPRGELFGYHRLEQLIASLPADQATCPDRVAAALTTALDAFTAQGTPTDDVTFLLLARQT